MIRVGIIFGGQSSEHEVSVSSARGVASFLNQEKYTIVPIGITKKGEWVVGEEAKKYVTNVSLTEVVSESTNASIEAIKSLVDIVIPIIHGATGEDGKLQGLLEMLGVPYLFSGVTASAIGIDKNIAKLVVANAGVHTADQVIIQPAEQYTATSITETIGFPVVVKPVAAGSSVGVSVVMKPEDFDPALTLARESGGEVMVERYIIGREFTVGVIGNLEPKALPIIEVIPLKGAFYDYQSKYSPGGSKHICPADISPELAAELEHHAVAAYRAIGCRDLARIDFIWSEDDEKPYFLEVNTIPGMTQTSLVPDQARTAGIDLGLFFDQLITERLSQR